jgi:hypothetical protein
MRDYFKKGKFTFVFPIDGDCVNCRDGVVCGDDLIITVKLRYNGDEVFIGGVKADKDGDCFSAQIAVKTGKNTINVTAPDDSREIVVYRLKNAEKGYRLSSDDNILFLKDIHENRHTYASIFDNSYLSLYKKAHDEYGVKVQLNLFYDTSTSTLFNKPIEYFDLTMMTDKFKGEWEQNSDWLKLSFHSKNEHMAKPYKNVSEEEIARDCEKVNEQIVRFAGQKTLAIGTTVHCGDASKDGVKELRRLGYKAFAGYYDRNAQNNPRVAYFYDGDILTHIGGRDIWIDHELDIACARIDRVINLAPDVKTNLDEIKSVFEDSGRGEFLEIMIHEQYFYDYYKNYIPAFSDIVLSCCKWISEQGYSGKLFEDILREEK